VPLIGPANAAVARYDGMLQQRILNLLKKEGIVRDLQPGSSRRAATLVHPELLNITERYDAFDAHQ